MGVRAQLIQQKKQGLNKLELKGNEILNELNIKYTIQVPMFNKFVVDVLIDNQKTIIQWDGIYWHSKPKRIKLDYSQDKYLKKCGYKVLRITNLEIKQDIDMVKDKILSFLSTAATQV